jgi:hypothetical protein
MFKTLFSLKSQLTLVAILSLPLVTAAQASRTWVAGMGDDVNPCSRSAPCKTFAGALPRTAVGGEINTLDAGGFGSVVISKSITIDGTGGMAGTLGALTNGILINITSTADPTRTVRLRRLSINGVGTGIDGIRIASAGQVFIDEVLIDGFSQHGINLGASGAYVSVAKSIIRNVKKYGVNLGPGGGSPLGQFSMESSSVATAEAGLYAGRGMSATVRDSSFLHTLTGVLAEGSDVALVNCLVAHSTRGLMARRGSAIRISQVTVTRNDTGLAVDGGTIISYKNNVVHGNGTDGAPTNFFPPV